MIDALIKRVSVTYKCYEMCAHRGKKVQLLVFWDRSRNGLHPWYSWNTARVGVKQAIFWSAISCYFDLILTVYSCIFDSNTLLDFCFLSSLINKFRIQFLLNFTKNLTYFHGGIHHKNKSKIINTVKIKSK
jgi:hypothetical protein